MLCPIRGIRRMQRLYLTQNEKTPQEKAGQAGSCGVFAGKGIFTRWRSVVSEALEEIADPSVASGLVLRMFSFKTSFST